MLVGGHFRRTLGARSLQRRYRAQRSNYRAARRFQGPGTPEQFRTHVRRKSRPTRPVVCLSRR